MKTLTKIAGFVAALVAVFFLAFAIGAAVGPIELGEPPQTEEHR